MFTHNPGTNIPQIPQRPTEPIETAENCSDTHTYTHIPYTYLTLSS